MGPAVKCRCSSPLWFGVSNAPVPATSTVSLEVAVPARTAMCMVPASTVFLAAACTASFADVALVVVVDADFLPPQAAAPSGSATSATTIAALRSISTSAPAAPTS